MPKRCSPNDITKIRDQLHQADPRGDLPYDLRWAVRTLHGEEVPAPEVLAEELVVALMDELVAKRSTAILDRLARLPHKVVAKTARAGLHRLRSQKVEIEVPPPAPEAHAGTGLLAAAPSLQGAVTMYDVRMQRVIWLMHDAPRGIVAHQARVSAEHGLLDFDAFSTTRRKFKQLQARIAEKMTTARVEPAVARWLIDDAARRAQLAGRGLPAGYARALQTLGPPPGGEHPALAVTPVSVPDDQLRQLFELRELAAWLPEQDFLRSLALRLEEVATSRIVVDDQQRRAQLAAAIERAVAEYHTSDRCRVCRQLLLDTTHLLAAAGRRNDASRVRAAAEIYTRPVEQIATHPLPRFFLERVVNPQTLEPSPPAAAKSEAGLILPG
jgi:hypothetical protein